MNTKSTSDVCQRREFIRRVTAAGLSVGAAGRLNGQDTSRGDKREAGSSTPQHLAVAELFTSQGCSSCPSADRVLAGIVERHEQENLAVLGLSFHVDYWNYLGWSDPFSSPRYSLRQKRYATVLKDRVYTPQILINGGNGMVGSRRKQLEAMLPAELARPHQHDIALQVNEASDGSVSLEFEVDGETDGWILNIATVSRTMTARATRGENAGKTLTHANVVREFAVRKIDQSTRGEVTISMPREETKHSVIAYVQNIRGAQITGAAEIALASA